MVFKGYGCCLGTPSEPSPITLWINTNRTKWGHHPLTYHLSSPVLWLCSTPHISRVLKHCNATRPARNLIHCPWRTISVCIIYSGSRPHAVGKRGPWKQTISPWLVGVHFLVSRSVCFSYVCNCLYHTWLSQFNSQVLQKNLPLSDCRWK